MTRPDPFTAVIWASALVMIASAAIVASRAAPRPKPTVAAISWTDPALARCRAAGEAALDDPDCRKAWDGARARFFGGQPRSGS
jgi:conjugative transfer region protein TrbK